MSNITTIESLQAAGYNVARPTDMFGRSSHIMSGDPIFEGGYRAVSSDEMFGVGSQFVEQDVTQLLEPTLISSGLYQLLVIASLILYLHMLLRSWGFIGTIWGDVFSVHSERRMANEGGELPLSYFKVMAIVVGVIMLALVGVRLVDLELTAGATMYDSVIARMASPLALLFVGVLVAWVYSLHTIVGWMAQTTATAELSSITTINFIRYVVLLYPLVGVWLVVPSSSVHGWGIAVISGSILLLLIYLKDTFVFFLAKKIPILYWILYLCTAFLLPISFVITVLSSHA